MHTGVLGYRRIVVLYNRYFGATNREQGDGKCQTFNTKNGYRKKREKVVFQIVSPLLILLTIYDVLTIGHLQKTQG